MRIPIILTVAVLVALAAAASLSGCQTPQQQTGTLAGGALIGNAVTAPPPGRCAVGLRLQRQPDLHRLLTA
jgi:hypothetical protein